ncbi:MATE family efflux transporter [candidate division KSB1 bacterium]|nr:MATE family efflux transporter [candidate division KSB1 bacterium]
MQTNEKNLTRGSISKNIWYLALPLMATNAIQTGFNLVDIAFVGRLGPESVAAVSLVGAIMMLPFSMILGLAIASGAMISRFYGSKDYHHVGHVIIQSILSSVFGGILVTIAGIALGRYLFAVFGIEDKVAQLAIIYVRILFIGTVPIALQFLIAAIFQALGDASKALYINVFGIMINIILDPLLIFGLWIFPRLEVAGAALATTIGRTLAMFLAFYLLYAKTHHLPIVWNRLRFHKQTIMTIVKIGVPSSLQMSFRSVSSMVMMGIISRYGTATLAAYGIGIRLDMLTMMPGFGLAAATATLVGQNLGAKEPKRAEQSSWYSAIYFIVIMSTTGVIFYAFPKIIFSLFNDSETVIQNGVLYLRIIVLSYPFIAVSIILTRALAGAGETIITMLITLFSLFGIAVPLAFLIPAFTNSGALGVWVAIAVSNMVHSIIITLLFFQGKWKKKKIDIGSLQRTELINDL